MADILFPQEPLNFNPMLDGALVVLYIAGAEGQSKGKITGVTDHGVFILEEESWGSSKEVFFPWSAVEQIRAQGGGG